MCTAYDEEHPDQELTLKFVRKIKGSDQGNTRDCIPYTLQHEIDIISGLDKFLKHPKSVNLISRALFIFCLMIYFFSSNSITTLQRV